VPLTGVFLVSVEIDGKAWPGVANIGVRPTVQGDGKAHLEVHVLDFAGDLYDRRLTVVFHQSCVKSSVLPPWRRSRRRSMQISPPPVPLSQPAPIANEEP